MRTLEPVREESSPASSSGRSVVATVVIAVAALWILSTIALLICTAGSRQTTTRELLIGLGTGDLIAAGENLLDIPPQWDFIAGDRLVLINEDTVDHWIGQWYVAAQDVTTVELQPVYAGVLLCSVHPDGAISITVEPSGFDWRLPTFPALLLGIPLGFVVTGVRRVMGALDDGRGA
jgi:hypothetical protein